MTAPAVERVGFDAVAEIVEKRAALYALLAEILGPPSERLVDRIRDGSLAGDLRDDVAWLGAEASWFDEAARALAPAAGAEPELDLLVAEHRRLFDHDEGAIGDVGVVTAELQQLAAIAHRESRAWREGEVAAATADRQMVQRRLERTLSTWADEVRDAAAAAGALPVYQGACEALARFVDVELGRSFEPSRLPWRDRRAGR
ncbi:MAG TPA: hypothetical protein VFV35_00865 [Acidimicrobiales bacterium]|nr:hypothetical protein [Acidimicrobiales bacterium]